MDRGIYKSAAIVRNSSDEEIADGEKDKGNTPQGVKRNRIRMVGRIGGLPSGDSDPGSGEDDNDDDEEPGPSNKTPLVGKPRPASYVTANGNNAVGPEIMRCGEVEPSDPESTLWRRGNTWATRGESRKRNLEG
ncbi:hypothetical protein F5050DRAFT_1811836 [Lentinula boryana]|uniref:Uncharacterized protein n=1 Tax=Lentinula boryana TaxID=40481 RepID=A0ABQ8Q0Z5_9AGAR|nr:hypothetical protein F5050DRAFT_1811836 [Lentinula boryana]